LEAEELCGCASIHMLSGGKRNNGNDSKGVSRSTRVNESDANIVAAVMLGENSIDRAITQDEV